jgi:hypothetical protein
VVLILSNLFGVVSEFDVGACRFYLFLQCFDWGDTQNIYTQLFPNRMKTGPLRGGGGIWGWWWWTGSVSFILIYIVPLFGDALWLGTTFQGHDPEANDMQIWNYIKKGDFSAVYVSH